jgi:hypothetical protein
MSDRAERLSDLETRIERVVLEPQEVRAPFTRLVRPILRSLGYHSKAETRELAALLALVATVSGGEEIEADREIERAVDELESNVLSVERACVVNGRIGIAQGAWLRRAFEILVHAIEALERGDPALRRMVARVDPTRLLPPLAVRAAPASDGDEPVASDNTPQLLELQLAAVDRLLDLARDERAFLARRRRILEAARQVLLESAAAIPLDEAGVEARRAAIGREIVRIDRLEAAGLAPDVALLHQARAALTRGDKGKLHAALVALDVSAADAHDHAYARRTERALEAVRGGVDLDDARLRAESLERSGVETFGQQVMERVREGYRRGRQTINLELGKIPAQYHERAKAYLDEGCELETISAALAVDGAFEVGGTLSPMRVVEVELRARRVAWPTPDLVLLPAKTIDDVARAVIDDPRTILLNLATGRLLTRQYVHHDRIERTRTRMVSEIRVYVLDGSTSMIGDRARTRDAILLAELSTLMQRFEQGQRYTRVSMFYRYFDTEVGAIVRVDNAQAALAAMQDVVGTTRVGGTNIEAALLASLQQISEARASDPDLSRAQIVLVSDGASPVSEEAIAAAREALGDLAVNISVIALGEENEALRAMVARQRARGERAFYHFVPDAALRDMTKGNIDRGGLLHLPSAPADPSLDTMLANLLDELVDLERTRDVESVERTEAHLAAEDELHISRDGARREVLNRDVRAIERRYARWFPQPTQGDEPDDRTEGEAVFVVLSAIAEIVSVIGGTALSRRAEAVELLDRLLPDAGISPRRYQRALAEYPTTLAPALAAIHGAVQG